MDDIRRRQLLTVKMLGASGNHSSVCDSNEEDPHDPMVCTTEDNELENDAQYRCLLSRQRIKYPMFRQLQ